MQFALQALSRHAQNNGLLVHFPASINKTVQPVSSYAGAQSTALHQRPAITRSPAAVRILHSEGSRTRLLISGRMADVCAALNRLAINEFACH